MKIDFLVAGAVTALLAMTAAAPPAIAQQVTSPDPKTVKAGTYKVEPYHTQVSFSISHFGFTDFSGLFSGAAGTLQLDPSAASASKLEVSIPVSSILTTVPVLDDQLKEDQWFDVAKYPKATFTSTKVTPTGKDSATIAGNLTLHGVTKPVTLKAHQVLQRRLRGGRSDQAQRFWHQAIFAAAGRRRDPQDRRCFRSSAVGLCDPTIPIADTRLSPSSFIG